jgi:hypothetical protein
MIALLRFCIAVKQFITFLTFTLVMKSKSILAYTTINLIINRFSKVLTTVSLAWRERELYLIMKPLLKALRTGSELLTDKRSLLSFVCQKKLISNLIKLCRVNCTSELEGRFHNITVCLLA